MRIKDQLRKLLLFRLDVALKRQFTYIVFDDDTTLVEASKDGSIIAVSGKFKYIDSCCERVNIFVLDQRDLQTNIYIAELSQLPTDITLSESGNVLLVREGHEYKIDIYTLNNKLIQHKQLLVANRNSEDISDFGASLAISGDDKYIYIADPLFSLPGIPCTGDVYRYQLSDITQQYEFMEMMKQKGVMTNYPIENKPFDYFGYEIRFNPCRQPSVPVLEIESYLSGKCIISDTKQS